MRLSRRLIGLVVVVLALVAPVAAMATSPTSDQYETQSQQIAATGGGGNPSGGGSAATSSNTIGSLPFTGLDLGVLAFAAVALLGAGLALRRLTGPARRSSS